MGDGDQMARDFLDSSASLSAAIERLVAESERRRTFSLRKFLKAGVKQGTIIEWLDKSVDDFMSGEIAAPRQLEIRFNEKAEHALTQIKNIVSDALYTR